MPTGRHLRRLGAGFGAVDRLLHQAVTPQHSGSSYRLKDKLGPRVPACTSTEGGLTSQNI